MHLEIPFPRINPAAITLPHIEFAGLDIGPLPLVRWYALGYIAGVLLGWYYATAIAARPKLWGRDPAPVSRADIDDFAFWVMIGILLGGRLGYVLFYMLPYKPQDIASDPFVVFKMWDGGMSFHGGLIGAALAVLYTTWSRKIPLLALGDVACAAAPIGIFLVRFANFINGELYGRPTDVPWGIRFPIWNRNTMEWELAPDTPVVHPSQLYEAGLEGALLFAILAVAVWRFRSLTKPGLTAGIFLVGYASFRTFVENFRSPDDFVHGLPPWLTMGMLLSAPMFLIGAWLIARSARAPKPA